jgi:predicted ATPase
MLLRLHIRGFKNLRDVDVRFGPLTCFVGPNGVGKSNIFDAIQFLRHLADDEFQLAAERVRGPTLGSYSPLELFWAHDPKGEIKLSAVMLVPTEATDDFGQALRPAITLLKYSIGFKYEHVPRPRLVLEHEELAPLKKGEAKSLLGFAHSPAFRESLVTGKRFGGKFISTSTEGTKHAVLLHGDGGSRGRPVPAAPSPRTVLAGTGSADYPTVVAARREMASWRSLHLESSSLRTPDKFGDADSVDEHGRHIAAALVRLTKREHRPGAILQEAANRLSALVPEVEAIRVDKDDMREQFAVQVKMRGSKLWLPPRSVSDGTLRFLALVTMQMDPGSSRMLCMEEPENGIHPSRITVLISLLREYVVDPTEASDEENPPRQVVLNSHSPEVMRQLDTPECLFVDTLHTPSGREAAVRAISGEGNWRGEDGCVEQSALARLIGGSPISERLRLRQLPLSFGTAG